MPSVDTKIARSLTSQETGRGGHAPRIDWEPSWEPTMNMELTQANFALEARRMMALTNAEGAEVKVLTGQVWLTTDGDLRDFFLVPGDAHRIARDGLTIINAFEPSVVHVEPPQPRPDWWKRWLTAVWDYLAAVGEARARAHMRRGIYHF